MIHWHFKILYKRTWFWGALEHDTKATSNTADVGVLDGVSVRLEEETHEAVKVKLDQGLTQTCLGTQHVLAA